MNRVQESVRMVAGRSLFLLQSFLKDFFLPWKPVDRRVGLFEGSPVCCLLHEVLYRACRGPAQAGIGSEDGVEKIHCHHCINVVQLLHGVKRVDAGPELI